MNIWNEQGAFYYNYTPCKKLGGRGVTGIWLSVHPSVDRIVPRLLVWASPYRAYGLPMGQRCFLLNSGSKGQRSSTLDIEVAILCLGYQENYLVCLESLYYTWDRSIYGYRVPEHYPSYLESLYHTYILLMRRRCSLSNFGSKGQAHWTLK